MTGRGGLLAAGALGALFALSACSSAGPSAPADGKYRVLAMSDAFASAPEATLWVKKSSVDLVVGDAVTRSKLTNTAVDAVICPPDTKGSAWSLAQSIDFVGVTFESPAIIGDCGSSLPARITLVDLASSSSDVTPFSFTRWIELCDVSDTDCPLQN